MPDVCQAPVLQLWTDPSAPPSPDPFTYAPPFASATTSSDAPSDPSSRPVFASFVLPRMYAGHVFSLSELELLAAGSPVALRRPDGRRVDVVFHGDLRSRRCLAAPCVSRPRRVLVAGTRGWRDGGAVFDALITVCALLVADSRDVTVVTGGGKGSGAWAVKAAGRLGMGVELHPAEQHAGGSAAGIRRDEAMVALGADACLGFPPSLEDRSVSVGTWRCLAAAAGAGVATLILTDGALAAPHGHGFEGSGWFRGRRLVRLGWPMLPDAMWG